MTRNRGSGQRDAEVTKLTPRSVSFLSRGIFDWAVSASRRRKLPNPPLQFDLLEQLGLALRTAAVELALELLDLQLKPRNQRLRPGTFAAARAANALALIRASHHDGRHAVADETALVWAQRPTRTLPMATRTTLGMPLLTPPSACNNGHLGTDGGLQYFFGAEIYVISA